MKLEVIVTTLDQAHQAQEMGADRLEVVMGISEGGLTPSWGMVEEIKEQISLPLAVMIRPHSQSFRYSPRDVSVMIKDIERFKSLKVENFVLGALDNSHCIDVPVMKELLEVTGDTPVTFHRAFDEVPSFEEALKTLSFMPQIVRILTSFGADSKLENLERLKTLTALVRSQGLDLLWGGGVTKENLSTILREIAPSEIHVGSAVRLHKRSTADLESDSMKFFLKSLSGY